MSIWKLRPGRIKESNTQLGMNKTEISEKIHSINKKLNDDFLIMDEKTHGFYKGQLTVYEIWLGTLKQ